MAVTRLHDQPLAHLAWLKKNWPAISEGQRRLADLRKQGFEVVALKDGRLSLVEIRK